MMKQLRFAGLVALVVALGPSASFAQDDQTLADIRQELTILYTDVQRLKRELSTTGSASGTITGGSVLERVAAMENALQQLTAKTEQLENRVNRVVTDGTNRIGDLEFRLVELEGGDVSSLGETTTLGGGAAPAVTGAAPAAPATTPNQPDLAVGEKADFERAQGALAAGDFRAAADLFETFNQTYPGGPLAAEADLRRGDALKGLGDDREAARAFLAAFTVAPTGPLAPNALFELGNALGTLGQTQEACVTLSEVGVRFPQSPFVSQAMTRLQTLNCG